MFTGLVQRTGRVERIQKKGRDLDLRVGAASFFKKLRKGDSVAVNGCCLTAVRVGPSRADFQAVPETLRRTNLGRLSSGDRVNLELPLRASDPLGGHFVQGHVDGTVRVLGMVREGSGRRLKVQVGKEWLAYLAPKGSLTLDGVSLTLAALRGDRAEVALVPHTISHTTLGSRRPGDLLNLEVDLLAKQIVGFLGKRSKKRRTS